MAIAPASVAKISMMMSVSRTVAVSTWRFSMGCATTSRLRSSTSAESSEPARVLAWVVASVMALVIELIALPTSGIFAVFSRIEESGVRVASVASE